MHLFIYKTDIGHTTAVQHLGLVLQRLKYIVRWTVDYEDVDHVLRIESTSNNEEEVLLTIKAAGYQCEALPD